MSKAITYTITHPITGDKYETRKVTAFECGQWGAEAADLARVDNNGAAPSAPDASATDYLRERLGMSSRDRTPIEADSAFVNGYRARVQETI